MGIAVGTSIGAIFVLCLLFAVASSAVLRIKKRKQFNRHLAFVDNIIDSLYNVNLLLATVDEALKNRVY